MGHSIETSRTAMRSTVTTFRARLVERGTWEVDWLPGNRFTRDQAFVALMNGLSR